MKKYIYSNLTPASLKTVPETVQSLLEMEEHFDLMSLDNALMVIGKGPWGVKQWERNVALG